jgi:hypothetical protein
MVITFTRALLRNAVWVAACIAVIADAASTQYALAANPLAYEANPLMAPIVNNGFLWPFTIGLIGLFTLLARPLWDYQPRSNVGFLICMFLFVAVLRFGITASNVSIGGGLL